MRIAGFGDGLPFVRVVALQCLQPPGRILPARYRRSSDGDTQFVAAAQGGPQHCIDQGTESAAGQLACRADSLIDGGMGIFAARVESIEGGEQERSHFDVAQRLGDQLRKEQIAMAELP